MTFRVGPNGMPLKPMYYGVMRNDTKAEEHEYCSHLEPLYSDLDAFLFLQKNKDFGATVLKEVKFKLEVSL